MKKKVLPIIIASVCGVVLIAVAIVVILNIVKNSNSINYDEYRYIEISEYDGEVTVERDDKTPKVYESMRLIDKDVCITGEDAELELLVDDDKHILAKEETEFKITAKGSPKSGKVQIKLVKGRALFKIDNKLDEDDSFEVMTGNATMSVRGTKFDVSYDKKKNVTSVKVIEGTVWAVAENQGEMYVLEAGDEAVIYESYTESSVMPVPIGDADDNRDDNNSGDSSGFINEDSLIDEQTMSTWQEAYKYVASDIIAFCLDRWVSFNPTIADHYEYGLLNIQGSDVPEMIIIAKGGDYSGINMTNPTLFVTFNEASKEVEILAEASTEEGDQFLLIDGQFALSWVQLGGSIWGMNEASIENNQLVLGGALARNSAAAVESGSSVVGTSQKAVFYNVDDINQLIDNY